MSVLESYKMLHGFDSFIENSGVFHSIDICMYVNITVQKIGVGQIFFNVFERKLLRSPIQHIYY